MGSTTGVVEIELRNFIVDKLGSKSVAAEEVIKGDRFTFLCSELVRPNDAVYKVVPVSIAGT